MMPILSWIKTRINRNPPPECPGRELVPLSFTIRPCSSLASTKVMRRPCDASPRLTSKIFGQPLEDGLVPKLAVLRLEHPMAFVGEVKELGWNPFALQRCEQAQALADRHAKIQFIVDDKIRRLEVGGEMIRRKPLETRSLPRNAVFPFVEPQFVCGAVHIPEIKD